MSTGSLFSVLLRLFAALAFLAGAPGAWAQSVAEPASTAAARTQARHGVLYELRQGDRRAWLFGTMHVGRQGEPPLDAEVMRALQQVRVVAVELDVGDAERMQEGVRRLALYPAGRSLADDLTPAELAKVEAWLTERGLERAPALSMRPWMLGATLAMAEAQRAGLLAELGADVVLVGVARASGRTIREIESIEEQFAVLGAGDVKQQTAELMELIDGLRSGDELADMRALAQAWFAADRAGLDDALARMRADPRASARRMVQAVIVGRNARMAERIDAYARAEPVLAAVGALHLVGPGSVPEELARRGWTVTSR